MEAVLRIETTRLKTYLELTKPRITLLVLITTLAGFYLSSHGSLNLLLLINALIGTALTAAGASALNMVMERDSDSLMRRTQNRPLPSGRLVPIDAAFFGALLASCGVLYLGISVNLLTAILAILTLCGYLFLYTPLKRKTSLSTWIGAVPGALPTLMGWAAARGEITFEAWILFSILYLWQLPHFLSLAWLYREDYARAGFPMLPVLDPDGTTTSRHVTLCCLTLLPITLIPFLLGLAGIPYFIGALALGLVFLGYGISLAVYKSTVSAKRLFRISIIYLPILLTLLMISKTSV
jgi:protoheme IX farnesyltransferase